jgi:hypothetical protein
MVRNTRQIGDWKLRFVLSEADGLSLPMIFAC